MPKRVVKVSDLSKKDIQVSGGALRIKNGSYNIRSNNGANFLAPFNQSSPLLNWTAPVGAKINAVAHVLFTDGLAYFTYNGTNWVLDWFYAATGYIYSYPFSLLTFRFTYSGTPGNEMVDTFYFLVNTTGVTWTKTASDATSATFQADETLEEKFFLDNAYKGFHIHDGSGVMCEMEVSIEGNNLEWKNMSGMLSGNEYIVSFIFIKNVE
jgi:hypothetical protein